MQRAQADAAGRQHLIDRLDPQGERRLSRAPCMDALDPGNALAQQDDSPRRGGLRRREAEDADPKAGRPSARRACQE